MDYPPINFGILGPMIVVCQARIHKMLYIAHQLIPIIFKLTHYRLSGTEALGYVLIHAPGSAGFRLEPTTTPAQVARPARRFLKWKMRPGPRRKPRPSERFEKPIRREQEGWIWEPPGATSRRFTRCRP